MTQSGADLIQEVSACDCQYHSKFRSKVSNIRRPVAAEVTHGVGNDKFKVWQAAGSQTLRVNTLDVFDGVV